MFLLSESLIYLLALIVLYSIDYVVAICCHKAIRTCPLFFDVKKNWGHHFFFQSKIHIWCVLMLMAIQNHAVSHLWELEAYL